MPDLAREGRDLTSPDSGGSELPDGATRRAVHRSAKIETRSDPPSKATTKIIEVAQGDARASGNEGDVLAALLGSCVAVCLYDPSRHVGGMNHIFQSVGDGPLGGSAVVAEVERLLNMVLALGTRRDRLVAKVAGGAQMLPRGRGHGTAISGVVLRYLAHEAIPLIEMEIGGRTARRVRFHPYSGGFEIRPVADPQGMDGVDAKIGSSNAPELF